MSVAFLSFLMRAVSIAVNMMAVTFPMVALLSPRIPPFFGYFFCRSAVDIFSYDPCRIQEEMFYIPGVLGKFTVNTFRFVGTVVTLITYATVFWNAVLVVIYEAYPSVLFQKKCLRQFRIETIHCAFTDHARIVLKHRKLQILNIMFNNIYSRDLFEIGLASFLLVVIPGGYFAVTMQNTSIFASIAGTYVILTAYACIVILFSMAGKVWSESMEFKWAWKRNDQLARNKLTRRYAKSFQDLKVKIGSTNFVERNTPFVLLSFCVEQTVSLVLMQKEI
jgi:hypothetical protein